MLDIRLFQELVLDLDNNPKESERVREGEELRDMIS